jgi:hypothetical protein
MGVIAGLVAFGLAYSTRPTGLARAPSRARPPLATPGAVFELHPGVSQLSVRSRDGATIRQIDLAILVDGQLFPVALARGNLRTEPNALHGTVAVPVGDATVDAQIDLRVDPARNALTIELGRPPDTDTGAHEFALHAELAVDGRVAFVPGVGTIADRATVSGGALVVYDEPHPIAIASINGPVTVDAIAEESAPPGEPMRMSATTPPHPPDGDRLAELHVVAAESSLVVWRELAELAGVPTAAVHGRVTGPGERALVIGRDSQGNPQVRALANERGEFDLDAPLSVVQWYAAIDPGRASGLASFVPGTPGLLLLDVSPGGDLHVTAIDADTRKPLTARLVFHGIDGTVDPSFGPDYRASGAGPVIDALRGDITTPLPAGRYRVAATKGIEWSIDAQVVTIAPSTCTRALASTRPSHRKIASCRSPPPASISRCRPSTTRSATMPRRSTRSASGSRSSRSPGSRSRPTAGASGTSASSHFRWELPFRRSSTRRWGPSFAPCAAGTRTGTSS